jgi:hypothetical protein
MNWKELMGYVSTAALLLPVLLIAILRLHRFKCFLALGIYYLLSFCYNLMSESYIHVGADFKRIFGIGNNLLELPLMFTFLAYFSNSPVLSKRIRFSVLLFIAFELIITLIYGYNKNAITIIMAPGLTLILLFSTWFTLRQIKITIIQGKATGKALMISSLLFAYGCYVLIYVLYYLLKTDDISEVFIMYFIAATLSALFLSAGMMIESKRIKKLEELKITRRELSVIYGQDPLKAASSKKAAAFENEQWN